MFQTVLNDPTEYGFKDATSICGNSKCVWADDVHCTYAMQKIFAAKMAQLLGAANVKIPTGSSSGGNGAGTTSPSSRTMPSSWASVGLFFGILLVLNI
jgi:phospholipase/lecithinase/hemolysin